jgi:hypothetical protein
MSRVLFLQIEKKRNKQIVTKFNHPQVVMFRFVIIWGHQSAEKESEREREKCLYLDLRSTCVLRIFKIIRGLVLLLVCLSDPIYPHLGRQRMPQKASTRFGS